MLQSCVSFQEQVRLDRAEKAVSNDFDPEARFDRSPHPLRDFGQNQDCVCQLEAGQEKVQGWYRILEGSGEQQDRREHPS